MKNRPIKENSCDGAPGGAAGAISYGVPYGTPSGGDNTQNPGAFDSNHSNQGQDSQNSGSLGKGLDQLYAKKNSPSPDEFVAGMKFELGQQIHKDKGEVKRIVMRNLLKNPKFYSGLHMLNITDKDMVDNMTETKHPNDSAARTKVTPNIEETKKIFTEMAKGHGQKYVVNSQICDVMKEMWEAKKQRSNWTTK